MTDFERRVRVAVMESFRDTSRAPTAATLAAGLGAPVEAVSDALKALDRQRALVLQPGTDAIWMAHPFSAVETPLGVSVGSRRWFANCAWDGLSILALLGDGTLEARSPATGETLRFEASGGLVRGEGVIHFLTPARRFWDDIGVT
ncbi:MAG: organomercurial lyase [Vicinamibacterales bacterium]